MNYLKQLQQLAKKAYVPYSNFPVSAILIDKEDNIWEGVNVENAAYPSGICAERSALVGAISRGKKPFDFKEIHILSNSDFFIVPCGACLQVCSELLDKKTPFFLYKQTGETKKLLLDELLPQMFNKDFF
ncbi:cytidine deaminase [Mesomycoplasma conjunctivae]|uniref:cytidine deaminase n=1 Tax=Mesomycoplasma conjunctivae TaxID=45361 RepID=UPI003DA59A6E